MEAVPPNMDPSITLLGGEHFVGLEGYKLVGSSTYVISILANCSAVKTATHIAGADESAGMLHNKMYRTRKPSGQEGSESEKKCSFSTVGY